MASEVEATTSAPTGNRPSLAPPQRRETDSPEEVAPSSTRKSARGSRLGSMELEPSEGQARKTRPSLLSSSFVTPSGARRRPSVAEIASRVNAASWSGYMNYEPDEEEDEEAGETLEDEGEKVKYRDAVMTLVINCIGGAMISFPNLMASNGMILTPLLCLLGAACCTECGVLIADACDTVEKSRHHIVRSYEMLAEATLGRAGKLTLMVTKNGAMLGFIIVFLQVTVDSALSLIDDGSDKQVHIRKSRLIRFAVVMPVFVALAMVKDMSQLAKLANVACVSVVIVISCFIGGSVWRAQLAPACQPGQEVTLNCLAYSWVPHEDSTLDYVLLLGKSMSFFVFCFAMLGTVPTLRSQLERREDMASIIRVSFSIISGLFLIIMFLTYWGFGQAAPDNSLAALAGPEFKFPLLNGVGSVCMIINVLLGMPIFAICFISVVESLGKGHFFQTLSAGNMAARAVLMCILAGLSYLVPHLVEMIGVISAVFCVFNNFLFPIAIFHKANTMSAGEAAPPSRKALHAVLCVIGLCVMVFGLWGSVSTLLDKMEEDKIAEAGKLSRQQE